MRSFSDVAGVDRTIVGRTSIRHIRNAFCETYKSWIADCVASVCGQALLNGSGSVFVPFLCLHAHDGADIRMRSPDDEDPRAFMCRSRSSNVLGQVVTLYTNFERVSIPMELVPLGSKNADTLATALDKALRYVSACAFPVSTGGNGKLASSGVKSASSGGAAGPEKWFLHILLGDGVGTNEAAAKTLWKMALDAPIGPNVRYFLVVLVCAARTASLATGAVVQGQQIARSYVRRGRPVVQVRTARLLGRDSARDQGMGSTKACCLVVGAARA